MAIVYRSLVTSGGPDFNFAAMQQVLLREQSLPEIWMEFDLEAYGIRFERQKIITMEIDGTVRPMFLDFYLPDQQVAIEIDGPQHSEPDAQIADGYKNGWCVSQKVPLVRIVTHHSGIGNRTEMTLWAMKLAERGMRLTRLQYGSGFGLPLMDMYRP